MVSAVFLLLSHLCVLVVECDVAGAVTTLDAAGWGEHGDRCPFELVGGCLPSGVESCHDVGAPLPRQDGGAAAVFAFRFEVMYLNFLVTEALPCSCLFVAARVSRGPLLFSARHNAQPRMFAKGSRPWCARKAASI